MTKVLLSMSTTTSMAFTQTKHPMTMGMMLLAQTALVCTISGTMYKSFWFSYILFMIMIGGMLVLFMYMVSLASNEMIYPSMKTTSIMLTTTLLIATIMPLPTNNKDMEGFKTMTINETTTTTAQMYNLATGSMTVMLVMYMLLTMIIVVNMVNVPMGPLRQTS
uniref:NADH-ubiquinone oxidoreductase chain 6 n=1 Tax=Glossotermes oculatus TaxID=280691 RepID=A0A0A7EAB5_9NEOP|nr:NADH dehydrogenase subunit 6 [Glossotermes oculatus]URH16512.1 NADH dehydrogenase subunit 6 [Glossotermes oculatus]